METKKIVESLRYCASNKGCADCPIGGSKYSYVDCCVMSVAAKRLEELEAELGKRTINDRPYEWISVEDRLPEKNKLVLGINKVNGAFGLWDFGSSDDAIGFISHWMPLPEPPKPKEPTFYEKFLEAFPNNRFRKDDPPAICRNDVFGYMGRCPMKNTENYVDCDVCWNQPYFEPEEEGERNVATSK